MQVDDFESGLGVVAFARLGLKVLAADLERDVRDAQAAAAGGDMSRILDDAAADNRRATAGVEVRGPGREPYALFMSARGLNKRVEAGLISRAEALEILGRDSSLKESLSLALGRYQAALNAASDAVVARSELKDAAITRAEAHADIGATNLYDNLRRARISGTDPTALIEASVEKAMENAFTKLVEKMPGMSAAFGAAMGAAIKDAVPVIVEGVTSSAKGLKLTRPYVDGEKVSV